MADRHNGSFRWHLLSELGDIDAVPAALHARPLRDQYRVLMLDRVVLARRTGRRRDLTAGAVLLGAHARCRPTNRQGRPARHHERENPAEGPVRCVALCRPWAADYPKAGACLRGNLD
jgi:hypothetical protein